MCWTHTIRRPPTPHFPPDPMGLPPRGPAQPHIFFRNFYEISSALTSVQWRRRGPFFFHRDSATRATFHFLSRFDNRIFPKVFFCSGLPVNPLFFIGPVPTRSLRDSAKCCIFNHFLVNDSFRGRRREFLHRDSATCTASLLTAHTC